MPRGSILTALLISMNLSFCSGWAGANDVISTYSKAGQEASKGFLEKAQNDGGSGTLPDNMQRNDLYPGFNQDGSADERYFFRDPSLIDGGVNPSQSDFRKDLYQDAQKGSQATIEGQAYSVISETSNKDRPDLRNDAMFRASKDVATHLDQWVESFSDCRKQQVLLGKTKTQHVPDIQECRQRVDMTQKCTIQHQYSADILLNGGGTGGNTDSLQACPGEKDCYEFTVGIASGCHWNDQACLDQKRNSGVLQYEYAGECFFFSAEAYVILANPEAITRAVLDSVGYDDHIKLILDGHTIYQNDQWLLNRFPNIEDFRAGRDRDCEHSRWGGKGDPDIDWRELHNLNIDVTQYFKQQTGKRVVFRMETADGDRDGRFYARIKIYFDKSKAFSENWGPSNCIEATAGYFDGFASGSVTCTKMPTSITPEGCARTGYGGGVIICPDELTMPWPLDHSNISKLCEEISVDVDYNAPITGVTLPCYTNAQGQQVCPTVTQASLAAANNACEEYENNSACSFVSSECVENMQGQTGKCYMYRRQYDCGYDVPIDQGSASEIICDGDISCMGESCIEKPVIDMDLQNQKFGEAASIMQALDMIKQDANCTKDSLTGQIHCDVFPGKVSKCHSALGAVGAALGVDCCKDPGGGPTLADYITLVKQLPKLDNAMMSLSKSHQVLSGYQTLHQGVVDAFKPVTSAIDNITGEIKQIQQSVQSYIDDMINNIQKQIGASTGSTAAGGSAGGATAGNMAGVVGKFTDFMQTFTTIYSYYSLAKIAINFLYGCKKEDLMTTINRRLKQCHEIGTYCSQKVDVGFAKICLEDTTSYCCYNSPLARIIQEGIRQDLGYGWGSARHPSCGGIPIDRLKDADWSKVNWAEWEALLNIANLNYANPAQRTLENLTSSPANPVLNSDGERPDAVERTKQRLQELNSGDSRYNWIQKVSPDPTGATSPN
ncbi:hypothetical protein D6779_04420 [Candidatus Parcubacteria bacterium]|nr:MAG: hypothetical protein D6779_04420 [Candidatus Parcubacteria bacterium]